MCGISGIVFSNKINSSNEIDTNEINKIINSIKNRELSDLDIINLSWKIKSNVNFLKYCKNRSYKESIKILIIEINKIISNLSEEIQLIDKMTSMSDYLSCLNKFQNLKDSVWFIDTEIKRWVKDIEYLSNTPIHKVKDNILIFYKDVSSIIRSIDSKLELRGRDSLGLSLQIKLKRNENLLNYKINEEVNEDNYKVEILKNSEDINFTFKTFNKIGALGENTNIIKKLIKSNTLLKDILDKNLINSAVIISHTRWASVGEVNIENTHPVIVSSKIKKPSWVGAILNGDIYNYKEFLRNKKNINFNKNCTTDCLAISSAIINRSNKSFESNKKIIKNFKGSFAIGIISSEISSEIHVFKKGTQGLYVGFSDDRIMFASDVYGLIEYCRYFYPLKSNEAFRLTERDNYNLKQLKFITYHNGKKKIILKKHIKETNITTRDIDKKNFNHFLEKEIFDTYDITESTINRYLYYSNKISPYSRYKFAINKSQIPEIIIKKLRQKEIKKIIITGMGTCYTAGVAISNYMREILNHVNKEIIIETTIASEGSGFYLDPDMSDTLVIVIAQSGTTIDTNVYVKKAKERGALSIAIANKREGDVTFIVDGTLYIGEGRDIEISVPSTKTYTAQVILGYILTLYLLRKLNKKTKTKDLFNKEVKKLLNTPHLVKKTLGDQSINKSIKSIKTRFLKYKSWVVAYDDSENSICANEIRIKLSENCYQAIPYLTLDQIINFKIKNSFITVVSNKNDNKISSEVSKLINNENFVVLISPKNNLKNNNQEKFKYKKNFVKISFSTTKKYYSFLPTILIGQLLSYYLAKIMDSRSTIFENYKNSLMSKKVVKNNHALLERAHQKGIFNIGISDKKINKLISNKKLKLSNKIRILDDLILQSRRTIDTIKHQAKTITVGAVREMDENNKKNKVTRYPKKISNKLSMDFYDEIINSFSKEERKRLTLNMKKSDYIYLKSEFFDEAHLYNIVNFISEIEKKVNKKNIIKLAQPYDLKIINKNNVLNLINKKDKKEKENTLNFSTFKLHTNIKKLFDKIYMNDHELKYHLWTICVSIILIDRLIVKKENINKRGILKKRIKKILFRDLNFLINSLQDKTFEKRIKYEIRDIHKVIENSSNIKCLGSGVNYNLAKFTSKRIMRSLKRSCAFDILENHKHIDISAESNIIIFIANIHTQGYQNDAFSEIQKIISHNNVPIIITNLEDNRFSNLSSFDKKKIKIIKLPTLPEICNSFLNIYIMSRVISRLQDAS